MRKVNGFADLLHNWIASTLSSSADGPGQALFLPTFFYCQKHLHQQSLLFCWVVEDFSSRNVHTIKCVKLFSSSTSMTELQHGRLSVEEELKLEGFHFILVRISCFAHHWFWCSLVTNVLVKKPHCKMTPHNQLPGKISDH